MNTLAAAAEGGNEAGPIGLVVVLCLLVALVFLIRSMNKHLRKVPTDFRRQRPPERVEEADPAPEDVS
jgi:hypothetical protein